MKDVCFSLVLSLNVLAFLNFEVYSTLQGNFLGIVKVQNIVFSLPFLLAVPPRDEILLGWPSKCISMHNDLPSG